MNEDSAVVEALLNQKKLFRCLVCGEEKDKQDNMVEHYIDEHRGEE